MANKKNIGIQTENKNSTCCITEAGFSFYISNEDKFKEEIDALGLEEIFYDCILTKHKTDSTKKLIAKKGPRGNRGPNLGYAGGQSHEKDNKSKVNKPTKGLGTQRYAKAAKNMTTLHGLIHDEAMFESYLSANDSHSRLDDFARTIDEENIFEQMGTCIWYMGMTIVSATRIFCNITQTGVHVKHGIFLPADGKPSLSNRLDATSRA